MYESFYHLRAKPFRLSPDSVFFYPSRGHKRALAYLRYGLSQGEGFVVITGAPGTGKTTLSQILLKEMDEQHLVVAHLTTTQLEADEMLRMVAASFGLRYEGMDKAGLLKTLEAFLLARSRERKRALLVVDEAQNLPARSLEELRMLSNLQVGDRALLQTFLLGQPQFRQMLEHPDLEQLRQRVIANYHLSALAADECKSYVESRLTQVGWKNDPSFTERAYETIYAFSEGVPRRINMLCDRVLLFSFLEELHEVNDDVLRQVTDELGQEVSGRPLLAEGPVESLLHTEKSAEAETALDDTEIDAGTNAGTTETSETPTYEVALDSAEKLDAALQQQERDSQKAEETDASSGPVHTKPESQPAPDVVELASAESSLLGLGDEPSVTSKTFTTEEDSSRDRVMPDDGWTQAQPLSEPAETDLQDIPDEPAEDKKTSQTDRFRVIPGGRDIAAAKREPVVLAPLPDAPGDTEEVTTRKILRLVLAFHRSPRSFPGLDDPTQPLPRGIRNILQLAVSDDEVLRDLRQISVMGISPAMLRAAARFFVRRVMFVPGGDNYRVLGLQQDASLSEIEVNYGLLMRLLRHDNAEVVDGGVSRVGAAYEQLCRGEKTAPSRFDEDAQDIDEAGAIRDSVNLDLDVAPKVADANSPPVQQTAPKDGRYVEIEGARSDSLFRNVILVAGVVVLLLVFYVTQIRGLNDLPEKPLPVNPPEAPKELIQNELSLKRAVSPELMPDTRVANVVNAEEPPQKVITTKSVTSPVLGTVENKPVSVTDKVSSLSTDSSASDTGSMASSIVSSKEDTEAQAAVVAAAELQALADAREKVVRAKAEQERKARITAEQEARAASAKKLAANQQKPVVVEHVTAAPAVVAVVKKPSVSTGITEGDLRKMMGRFESYYETGDLRQLMALFSPQARTDTQTTRKGIRSQYQEIFSTSSKQNIGFIGMSWKLEKAFARGRGKFQTVVLHKGDSVPVITSGTVTVQVVQGTEGLQISRLYFSDVKMVEGTEPNKQSRLTEDDLNPLMTAFVTYYEAGDIGGFMDLFSSDASTNDRSTIQGIRKDYEGLFEDTFKRRMKLQNLTWILDGNIARGESNYSVSVQPEEGVNEVFYQGTLWVQIEPRNGLARITHFAFVD